jgi:hypothetical protein
MSSEKTQQVKDAIREIQNILRQRELLNGELSNFYNVLKDMGYPKPIVNSILKNRQKPRFQIESEKLLMDELQNLLDS